MVLIKVNNLMATTIDVIHISMLTRQAHWIPKLSQTMEESVNLKNAILFSFFFFEIQTDDHFLVVEWNKWENLKHQLSVHLHQNDRLSTYLDFAEDNNTPS